MEEMKRDYRKRKCDMHGLEVLFVIVYQDD